MTGEITVTSIARQYLIPTSPLEYDCRWTGKAQQGAIMSYSIDVLEALGPLAAGDRNTTAILAPVSILVREVDVQSPATTVSWS
jgi:hypothetical protein